MLVAAVAGDDPVPTGGTAGVVGATILDVMVQGQLVMVRVVASVTVKVMLFTVISVGAGQKVVYAVTT